jgi:hypothetical protein
MWKMPKNYYATLDGHRVVPVDRIEDCMLATAPDTGEVPGPRHVAYTELPGANVSTVFLSINHGYMGTDLWFETMIFGGEHDDFQERYETWEEAEAGHARAVQLATSRNEEQK